MKMIALALSRSVHLVDRLADFVELTKPRIALMVLFTVFAGGVAAADGVVTSALLVTLLHAVVGTALVAAGSCVLNQAAEVDVDARMSRTADRPLPAGRVLQFEARYLGFALSVVGTLYLFVFSGALPTLLAVTSLVIYVWIYTPLKQSTSLNTAVGAVSGALPPVIGWAAVRGTVDLAALMIFLILFFWQFPHFLAIAWMYREDYKRAGLKMLPTTKRGRQLTGFQAISYCVVLLPAAAALGALGLAGPVFFWGSLILGVQYLAYTMAFQWNRTDAQARQLLYASLVYLPALFGLLMTDVILY